MLPDKRGSLQADMVTLNIAVLNNHLKLQEK